MNTIKDYLKTFRKSNVLILILWLCATPTLLKVNGLPMSLYFGIILFGVPIIINEIFRNPFFKKGGSKFFTFIQNTTTPTLFYVQLLIIILMLAFDDLDLLASLGEIIPQFIICIVIVELLNILISKFPEYTLPLFINHTNIISKILFSIGLLLLFIFKNGFVLFITLFTAFIIELFFNPIFREPKEIHKVKNKNVPLANDNNNTQIEIAQIEDISPDSKVTHPNTTDIKDFIPVAIKDENCENTLYTTIAKLKNNFNDAEISGSFVITPNGITFKYDANNLLLNKRDILSATEIKGGVMIRTKYDTYTFYLWSSHIVIEKIYELLQKPIPQSARLESDTNNQNRNYLNETVIYSCSAKLYEISNVEKVRGKLIITSQRMVFENKKHDVILMHKDIVNVFGTSDALIVYSIYGNYMLTVDNPSLAANKFKDILKNFETPTAKFKYNKFNLLEDIDEDDISCVDGMDGHDFEYWCADLLERSDFDKVTVTRASGDQGVDIIAVKDGIRYAIQCKNYYDMLGNKPIQEVCTGRLYYDCDVAVVMTNSHFTPHALDLAKKTGVRLWDREKLQDMMDDAY